MTEPKYRKGYPIFGLDDLMSRLKKGQWVYFRDRPKHPGFILNMTLATVEANLTARRISEAVDRQKEEAERRWRLKP